MRVESRTDESEEKLDEIYLVPHTHYDAICFLTKEDFFYVNVDLILKRIVDILGCPERKPSEFLWETLGGE